MISALATYRAFYMFISDAVLSPAIPFVNSVILLLIWFLSFTSKSGFVRNNKIVLIVIPFLSIQLSNIVVLLNNSMTSFTGLVLYMTVSTGLIYFSYWASIFESRIS